MFEYEIIETTSELFAKKQMNFLGKMGWKFKAIEFKAIQMWIVMERQTEQPSE